jgi:hypothetical protein
MHLFSLKGAMRAVRDFCDVRSSRAAVSSWVESDEMDVPAKRSSFSLPDILPARMTSPVPRAPYLPLRKTSAREVDGLRPFSSRLLRCFICTCFGPTGMRSRKSWGLVGFFLDIGQGCGIGTRATHWHFAPDFHLQRISNAQQNAHKTPFGASSARIPFRPVRLGAGPLLVLMGQLPWHDLCRFVSITASMCPSPAFTAPAICLTTTLDAVWASFWGMLFRKFFWDFLGGILRNPGGIQSVLPSFESQPD